ncbi:hypothetical protein C2R22_09460 [Salinigranum rubrum]|uniref:Uncharacterized protein n=1 Tax=Salinigranum rubrum TaxID=755307 RepID=A0A2I8VIU1_9EURY|nr:MTH865 family protein [Salinigranum rubrum]AUV81847.1 hypothetical protein C2R22_09460 [Salinigranum rubrum]
MTDTASTTPLRAQLFETFDPATFPVQRPVELLPVMVDGRDVFVADDREFAALELALTVGEYLQFPYEAADDLVDDIVTALGRPMRG